MQEEYGDINYGVHLATLSLLIQFGDTNMLLMNM